MPRGDEGRYDEGESEYCLRDEGEDELPGEGERGGRRREDETAAGVGEKTSASVAGKGRTGVGGMMRGEARRAVGLDDPAGAGELGWSAELVMACSAPRPPGGATI